MFTSVLLRGRVDRVSGEVMHETTVPAAASVVVLTLFQGHN